MKNWTIKDKIKEIKQRFSNIDDIPESHDGCYEFIQNIIEQYKNEKDNSDNWGLTDLDLLYYATTFESTDIKKDRIRKSHIKNQEYLYNKLQELEEKKYTNNIDGDKKYIGMFNRVYAGFASNNPSPNITDNFAKKFILLCIDLIQDNSNNTEIYEKLKNNELFIGIKAQKASSGIISQILHCIKPNTFPILNNAINFYKKELGIKIINQRNKEVQISNKLNNYIADCIAIENYKNINNLAFKNYRILDLISLEYDTTNINYKAIYDFLQKYAGKKYTKSQIDIAEAGKKASDEVKKFCNKIDDRFKKLKLTSKVQWQKGRGQSVAVKYFWLQFKYPDFKNEPYSISLVFYVNESNRLWLDIKTEVKHDAPNADIEKFNKSVINPPPNGFRIETDKRNKIHTIKTNEIDINNINKEYLDGIIDETKKDIELIIPNYEKIFKGDNMKKLPHNLILYGPPGTGKTYNTVVKAMEIIGSKQVNMKENGKYRAKYSDEEYKLLKKEFNEYKQQGRIEFITFHQSYSYEEFVEGIKPVILDKENWGNPSEKIQYTGKDGIFKEICKRAKQIKTDKASDAINFAKTRIFKMSLGANWDNETEDIYNYCLNNNVVALGWGDDKDFSNCNTPEDFKGLDKTWGAKAMEIFKNWMRIGDIILISNGNSNIKAIAKITGEYEYHNDTEIRYCQYRNVKWLYNGEDIPVSKFYDKKLSQQSIYGFYSNTKEGKEDYNATIKTNILNEIITGNINDTEEQSYVLIIDEINRGNISKIFGELITLIEEDKRLGEDNEITVTLPYSQQKDFGVPNNLYIIGTMNTADKSIAQIDTALRRRFVFEEMPPKPELLKTVDGYDLEAFLNKINSKIEEKCDKHHKIGHAYLMNIENEDDLEIAFLNKIYPLLQEYFYDDEDEIAEILGTKKDENNKDWWKTVIPRKTSEQNALNEEDFEEDIDEDEE